MEIILDSEHTYSPTRNQPGGSGARLPLAGLGSCLGAFFPTWCCSRGWCSFPQLRVLGRILLIQVVQKGSCPPSLLELLCPQPSFPWPSVPFLRRAGAARALPVPSSSSFAVGQEAGAVQSPSAALLCAPEGQTNPASSVPVLASFSTTSFLCNGDVFHKIAAWCFQTSSSEWSSASEPTLDAPRGLK